MSACWRQLDALAKPPHPPAMPRLYTTFAEFWPFYLREHAKAATQWLDACPRNSDLEFLRALPEFVVARTH